MKFSFRVTHVGEGRTVGTGLVASICVRVSVGLNFKCRMDDMVIMRVRFRL